MGPMLVVPLVMLAAAGGAYLYAKRNTEPPAEPPADKKLETAGKKIVQAVKQIAKEAKVKKAADVAEAAVSQGLDETLAAAATFVAAAEAAGVDVGDPQQIDRGDLQFCYVPVNDAGWLEGPGAKVASSAADGAGVCAIAGVDEDGDPTVIFADCRDTKGILAQAADDDLDFVLLGDKGTAKSGFVPFLSLRNAEDDVD